MLQSLKKFGLLTGVLCLPDKFRGRVSFLADALLPFF
jgi:hypothetical protein